MVFFSFSIRTRICGDDKSPRIRRRRRCHLFPFSSLSAFRVERRIRRRKMRPIAFFFLGSADSVVAAPSARIAASVGAESLVMMTCYLFHSSLATHKHRIPSFLLVELVGRSSSTLIILELEPPLYANESHRSRSTRKKVSDVGDRILPVRPR